VETYIALSQESSRWVKIQNPDIVRLGLSMSFWGFLGQSRTLSGWWFLFWMYEKDLTCYFYFIHTPLLIVRYSYTKKYKNTLKHRLSSFKDHSFELTRIWGSLFPFLLFGCLNFCLILIETIRFLFGLFSITEIN
jgi:hypothetical protein